MSSRRDKPPCQGYSAFLNVHLGKGCLAPLTGQDAVALHAFLHAVQLWGRSDADGQHHAEVAMRSLALAMQPSTRHLAKRAIPHVLDWSHEAQIWSRIFPDDPALLAAQIRQSLTIYRDRGEFDGTMASAKACLEMAEYEWTPDVCEAVCDILLSCCGKGEIPESLDLKKKDGAHAVLAACAPEMTRMLLELEWDATDRCPRCRGGRPGAEDGPREEGHVATCDLDVLLRKAGAR